MSGSDRRKAKLRQRVRAWKAQVNRAPRPRSTPVTWGAELEYECPDPANHEVCPASGGEHHWIKPYPRPRYGKYACEGCGHSDINDYG